MTQPLSKGVGIAYIFGHARRSKKNTEKLLLYTWVHGLGLAQNGYEYVFGFAFCMAAVDYYYYYFWIRVVVEITL